MKTLLTIMIVVLVALVLFGCDRDNGVRPDAANSYSLSAPEGASATALGITPDGKYFTVNNDTTYLMGVSYFGATGIANWNRVLLDLNDMQAAGFNWIRIWAFWESPPRDGDASNPTPVDISVLNRSTATVRSTYMNRLKNIIAECDQRGMIVDVTWARVLPSKPSVFPQTYDEHLRCSKKLAEVLEGFENVYFDIGNECNVGIKRLTIDRIGTAIDAINVIDPSRICTASFRPGGPFQLDSLRWLGKVDFLAAHGPDAADTADDVVLKYISWMEQLNYRMPVHFNEVPRRGVDYSGWTPDKIDFYHMCVGAKVAMGAGWCFHNGWEFKGSPFRSFHMMDQRLYPQLDDQETAMSDGIKNQIVSLDAKVRCYQAEFTDLCAPGSGRIGEALDSTWIATAGVHSPGYITGGPYCAAQSGYYLDDVPYDWNQVSWRFMITESGTTNDQILKLDVYSRQTQQKLAALDVYRDDFNAVNQCQDFTLSFDCNGEEDLQLRAYWTGEASVACDRVVLQMNTGTPEITVTSPAGGESFGRGFSEIPITWTTNVPVGNVRVRLIQSDGTYSQTIVSNTAYYNASHTFPIPADVPEGTYYIRVRTLNGTLVRGDSELFTIAEPAITVTYPEGGEHFGPGQEIAIRWETEGIDHGRVDIDVVDPDRLLVYPVVRNLKYFKSPCDYVIPSDMPKTTYLVRITHRDDPTITDDSEYFMVGGPLITVTSPAEGDTLTVGEEIAVRWDAEGFEGDVRIDMINPDRDLVYTISEGAGYDNSPFDYTIPSDVVRGTYFIRVAKADDESVFDDSGYFTVKGPMIAVTSPAGGEGFDRGEEIEIVWTTEGFEGTVLIELIDAATDISVDTVAVAAPYDDSPRNYEIPGDILQGGYVIRVSKSDDETVSDDSGEFTISEPSITVTFPTDGLLFAIGDTLAVQWTTVGLEDNVKIDMIDVARGTIYPVTPETDGSPFLYEIPAGVPRATYIIRITSLGDESVSGDSGYFEIVEPYIGVTFPAGGEGFDVGQTIPIGWAFAGVAGDVRIELVLASTGVTVDVVTDATSCENSPYDYEIPLHIEAGTYVIRITSLDNPSVLDESGPFTILEAAVTVTGPAGGEVFARGGTMSIEWAVVGFTTDVQIDLINPGRDLVFNVLPSTAYDNSPFVYTIPYSIPRGDYIVRITSIADESVFDDSELFTILDPVITVVSPGGGEEFNVGDTIVIRWNTIGVSGELNIDMIDPARDLVYPVAVNVAYDSSHVDYVVGEDIPSAQYLIRIRSIDDESLVGDSEMFTVVGPSVTVTSPSGGEAFDTGETMSIAWLVDGFEGDVRLELIDTATQTTTDVIDTATPHDNTPYDYVIPAGIPSGDYVVRVSKADDPAVFDDSGVFSIGVAVIDVTFPVGEETFAHGETISIAWTAVGFTGNVKIDLINYDRDLEYPVVGSTPSDGSPYDYVVPADLPLGTYYIRVSKTDDETVTDNSGLFMIIGAQRVGINRF
jgi:hypothetical protein